MVRSGISSSYDEYHKYPDRIQFVFFRKVRKVDWTTKKNHPGRNNILTTDRIGFNFGPVVLAQYCTDFETRSGYSVLSGRSCFWRSGEVSISRSPVSTPFPQLHSNSRKTIDQINGQPIFINMILAFCWK